MAGSDHRTMYSRSSRYSPRSPSPYYHSSKHTRSLSSTPSRSRSRSRSWDFTDVVNPGNNLYVTGLSSRISKMQLEEHFSSEGKVLDIHLVIDPYTRESRGFGFVTMSSIGEAEKCIKYLDGSVLEGRTITVEKAKRRRGRTPTPGRYLGLRTAPARRRSSSYSPYHKSRFSSFDRERSDSSYYYGRARSHRRRIYYSSPDYSISPSRSLSPRVDRRLRSPSRSISPPSRRRMCRRSYSKSISPRVDRRMRSYSRSISPAAARRRIYRRSYSRSISPSSYRKSSRRRSYHRNYSRSRSISPRSISSERNPSSERGYSFKRNCHSRSTSPYFKRNYSISISPRSPKRSHRRNNSPASRRRMRLSYSRSISPSSISSGRSPSPKIPSSKMKRGYSRESYSHSRSLSPYSRSGTR